MHFLYRGWFNEYQKDCMEHEIIVAAIKVLEFLFAAGLIGSVILILLTSIEDFREVLHRDTAEEISENFGD